MLCARHAGRACLHLDHRPTSKGVTETKQLMNKSIHNTLVNVPHPPGLGSHPLPTRDNRVCDEPRAALFLPAPRPVWRPMHIPPWVCAACASRCGSPAGRKRPEKRPFRSGAPGEPPWKGDA